MSIATANDVQIDKLPSSITKKLNVRIEDAIREQVTPSIGLAVFHRDQPIFNGAWGYIDPETESQPVTTNTLFDLASLTKLYASVALFSLMTEEAVYLHSPVTSVIPEFGASGSRPIEADQDPLTGETLPVDAQLIGQMVNPEQVTFFHLLTQTSGLPRWRPLYEAVPVPPAPEQADLLSRETRWTKILARLNEYAFVGIPDTIVRPSDLGAMLIGEAAARLHSDANDLEAAIQRRVLADRFDRTTFTPLAHDFEVNEIAPTEYDEGWRKRRIHGTVHDENAAAAGGLAGNAGLFATAFDAALFGNIWLNHAEKMLHVDLELAGAASELQAQTDNRLRGLGWQIRSPQNASASDEFSPSSYGHTGFTGTSLWIDPRSQLVIALLTNAIYFGRDHVAELHDLRRAIHAEIGRWAKSV